MADILLIKAEQLRETEHWVVDPLGLLYLASVARNRGHRVEILDLRIIPPRQAEAALHRKLDKSWDFIGLSALTHQSGVFQQVAKRVRRQCPESLIVAGGPITSTDPEFCLEGGFVDMCVQGEGEQAFDEILARMEAGGDFRHIPGVILPMAGGGMEVTPMQFVKDLDSLPVPAWDLVDFDVMARHMGMAMRMGRRATVQTSRGCPFHCVYCHSMFGKKHRVHSVDRALSDLGRLYHEFGIRRFEIVDDIFNWDRPRAKKILTGIASRLPGSRLYFPNGLRGDVLDAEIIRLLKEAGTQYLAVAVESASPRLQQLTKKNVKLDKLRENVEIIRQQKIHVAAFFMVGFPTETPREIKATLHLAKTLPVDLAHISTVTAYRGTPLWDMAVDRLESEANVTSLDPRYGYGGLPMTDVPVETLARESLSVARSQIFRNPSNWFILWNELRWRLTHKEPLAPRVVAWLTRGRGEKWLPSWKNSDVTFPGEEGRTP